MDIYFQDLQNIYSLMFITVHKILNDLWKKNSSKWIVFTNSTYIFPSRFIVVCVHVNLVSVIEHELISIK
jgi:hypothetical protein